jgi:FG-GAP-like repeat
MLIQSRTRICLLFLTACSSSLVAQTVTFSQPKSVLTFGPGTFYFQTLDLDGDGNTDLDVCANIYNCSVYRGDGKGGFSTTPLSIDVFDPAPIHGLPVFIDVNGDGIDDEVFAFSSFAGNHFDTTNGQFIVALGDGAGGFISVTELGGLPLGTGTSDDPLVAGDFNADGKVDFAFLSNGGLDDQGNPQSAAITVFLNQGNGAFAQQNTIWLQGRGHWALVAGDFNGDIKDDLAWTQLQSDEGPLQAPYAIHYMYSKGNGAFSGLRTYWTDTAPVSLAEGVLNGDPRADLVLGLAPGGPHRWRIATLLAKQTSGFYWASDVSSNTPTDGVQIMNLNWDEHPDLIYHTNLVRAGLSNNKWSPSQAVGIQTPPAQSYGPFVKLNQYGLPAFFSTSVDSSQNIHINVQINTSK